MKKKILLIGAVLLVAIFCFSLVGCAKKTATTTTSTLDQLQAAVTQLQTDVNAIELELSDIDNTALSNLVTTLQTTVNTLTTRVNGIQTALDALSDNGGVSSTIEAEVTSLRVDLTSLSNTYNTLANTIAGIGQELLAIEGYDDTEVLGLIGDLADRVTDLEDAIEDFITDDVLDDFVTEDDLEDILNDIEVLNANDIYLQSLITTLQGQIYGVYSASITEFDKGLEYFYIKANSNGNYVIVLTLYGTGLDILEINQDALESQNIELYDGVVFDEYMSVLTFIAIDNDGAPSNWQKNKTFKLSYSGNVSYATIQTGTR